MRLNCELAPNSVPLGLLSFGALAECDGALTQEFDAARRAEIQEAFAVTRETANQTSIFFANRAAEETKLRDDADKAKAAGDTATYDRLTLQADGMRTTYGSGSPLRILSTAFNAAASGGNAAGGLGSLAQGAVVGVLQSLAVTQIKHIADSLMTETPGADGTVTCTQNPQSEALRAALQAIVACGGASAAGAGCGGAAMGAGVSAAMGSLLNLAMKKDSVTYVRGPNGALIPDANSQRSLEEQQAVTQLIGTSAGIDVELDRVISLRLRL